MCIQSNLGSRTPRITNNSVYEQIFRTHSVLDDILCLELRTRKPSTSWSDKLGVSASAVFVEEEDDDDDIDIVSLGKNMDLEVNIEDVEELLEDHKDELSTEELEQLQKQLQRAIVKEMSSEEEEGR
ncbi:hypothetical protein L798_12458 [Zootermopsis nevadensis]|uniref:Uncharacterized protein n=1 Tax=Zootermopsis nevadensis TaxID=136037 RepID=A0A067QUN0_ZOONE|nr:hypothetical protein L798_12458 [Zootermopsis nevadensis]